MDEGTWDNLKSACSNSSPAGVNCEYDTSFLDLMDLASPRPEIQMGSTVIAARLPDWPAILKQSLALSQTTRDLRVGVILVESLAQLHGWNGLAEGFEILWCWTTQLWSNVYPELDREEDNDPTARLSALTHLLSDQFIQRTLYQLPLVDHPTLGTLRLRDTIAIVKGKKEVARELTAAEIEAFFAEADSLALAVRLKDLDRSCAAMEALDQFLNGQPGTEAWSAARLLQLLQRSRDMLFKHFSNQLPSGHAELASAPVGQVQAAATMVSPIPSTIMSAAQAGVAQTVANQTSSDELPAFTGQDPLETISAICVPMAAAAPDLSAPTIRSRHQATAAIDAVCEYFQIHEPASPVPFLLQRAKRLISMNFVELMHELAPNEAMQLLRQLHVVDKAG